MDRQRLRTLLDQYYHEVDGVIIRKQHPVSGLLPASTAVTSHGNYQDAWVRDNVYSILAVWGLALAYRQLEDNEGRGYELEYRTVTLMRGLLRSMMAQSAKVEAFKLTRHPHDALHAKYDTETGGIVVGDTEWGHLQVDATSLYLLMLAQMISSGLSIIWTMPEVNFVQNLVYYIERAYRTPDYGIWERGAKTNRGSVELNASSVGMAKAALEALSGFNLFGAKGSQGSVIHVAPDNIAQANITLTSLLPRESNTKEIDAALLSVISYPAFAVSDTALVDRVRNEIVEKLQGNYGLKRFLRDGHQTVLEDEGRLHYEQRELKQFEHIESEWPLFYAYLYLDAIFRRDDAASRDYEQRLESVAVTRGGFKLLPELYYVPRASIEEERLHPHSVAREPNANVPLVWAQSLWLLGRMLRDGVLMIGDIDPMRRWRLKVPPRPVVQLLVLAEDEALQAELMEHGVVTETPADIAPVSVFLPDHVAQAHGQVGRNDALGLTGRSARALKSLTTSRFYRLGGTTGVCLASFFMNEEFFLAYDMDFVVRRFASELAYLNQNWTAVGRPTVTVLLTWSLLEGGRDAFYSFMSQVVAGEVDGVPVRQGKLTELITTASFERIDNLHDLQLPSAALSEWMERAAQMMPPALQTPLTRADRDAVRTQTDTNALVARFENTSNLYERGEILAVLIKNHSLDERVTLRGVSRSLLELAEEAYDQAGRLRLWAVVRSTAGILRKVDGDLSLAVGAILVRQKNIQIGRVYSDEGMITQPLPEHELLAKVRTFCNRDVRDQVLTQELLLYISLLIKSKPELFEGLLTVRVNHMVSLLVVQYARERMLPPNEAFEELMHLAPSAVQQRFTRLMENLFVAGLEPSSLRKRPSINPASQWQPDLGLERIKEPPEGWSAWRKLHGTIDRRTQEFYAAVWNISHHTTGIVIGERGKPRGRMDGSIVASDTTPMEVAFALWLEQLLNQIDWAEYRQLTVETLLVVASYLRQHRNVHLKEDLEVDVLIDQAVALAARVEQDGPTSEAPNRLRARFLAMSPARSSAFICQAFSVVVARGVAA